MKKLFLTIYFLLFAAICIIFFGVGPIIDQVFKHKTIKADRELAKGTFSLVIEKLQGFDENTQDKILKQLQPRFGYPLALYKPGELHIDDDYKDDFFNGLIVDAEKTKGDDSDMLVQLLMDSQRVLAMGDPFSDDKLYLQVTIFFICLTIVSLILPAMAWTFFLNRDIRKIEKSAALFASGDHSARVAVSKISSLTLVASALNNMTDRTQNLIESQKELSNSVSHEIRTPLARIKFSLEMLLDNILPEGKTYISQINMDVEEIEALVDEMLTYARFERESDTSENLEKQEIISWLKAIVINEAKDTPDKNIKLKTEPETKKFIINFEPVYLGWAVKNLMRNASRYAKKNIDIIFVPGDTECLIHVDDDGLGIPENIREKVFNPFFRIDKSRSKKSGGYGLGLAIAKRIVIWHHGSISIDQPFYNGARFTIKLPVTATGRSDLSP